MKCSLISSSQPQSVVFGHLNDDHEIDIVVVNSGTNTIGILLSKGNGTFAKQHTYSTGVGSRPSSVVVNDFNKANYSDIIVTNYGTNNISIHLGNGNGTFSTVVPYSTDIGTESYSISIGDLDHDSYSDLVVTSGNGYLVVFLGYGNVSFIIWDVLFTVRLRILL